jgi:hypothetical protein
MLIRNYDPKDYSGVESSWSLKIRAGQSIEPPVRSFVI